MTEFHFYSRRAGVLLHPTSFPSGNLDDVPRWLDFMSDAGLSVWQMLPLGIPQDALSPYQCLSAFAVNPALFSEIPPLPVEADREFLDFCEKQQHWLDDFTLFVLLKERFENASWYQWPEEYRDRDAATLEQLCEEAFSGLQWLKWQQYVLFREWQALRRSADEKRISFFGDMPIFVAHDSADVWAHPELFLLDENGMPTTVTGVPPDYFSESGQRWGNPHYNWQRMEESGFSWWLERLHYHFEWFDLVRIDHFRGLVASWMIDAACETAVDGYWQETPGDALLSKLQQEMGEIPLVAEDLGVITDEVRALRKRYKLPGMSVLQFSFDAFDDNPHKPKNILPDTVVYSGTHDNDTTRGWFDSLDDEARSLVVETLGIPDGETVVEKMIETAMSSEAALAMIPMQDFLGLGSETRMNTPGTVEGNWSWQFSWDKFEETALATGICSMVENGNRVVIRDEN